MTQQHEYNGWTNYDTWNYFCWIDEHEYRIIHAITQRLRRNDERWDADKAREVMVDLLGAETPDGARASNVDWEEIAEAFDEYQDEIDERSRLITSLLRTTLSEGVALTDESTQEKHK